MVAAPNAPTPDPAQDLPQRARVVLRETVERVSSLTGLGLKAGRSMQWVWRLVNRAKSFSLEKTLTVLHEAEVPSRFYFSEWLEPEPALSPAWLLRHFREKDADLAKPPLCAVLENQHLRLRAEKEPGRPGLVAGPRRLVDELADADERRHTQPAAVRAELEQWVAELCAKNTLDRGDWGDLLHVLASLAIIERRSGHRNNAIELLASAFELAVTLGEPGPLAHLYGRAAFLLTDLGQCHWALWAVDHATRLFVHAGQLTEATLTLSERAVILLRLARYDEAEALFLRTLENVPADKWRVLASAHSGLAAVAEQRGDWEEAEQHLRRAVALYQAKDGGFGALCWRAGLLARSRGKLEDAEVALRQTLEALARHGQPLDVALAAVDLADIFARRGQKGALRQLGEDVLPWLLKFRQNSWAEEAVGDLARLLCHGEVTVAHLAKVRRRLQNPATASGRS